MTPLKPKSKPTIEEQLAYVEEINHLTAKTFDHVFGAFLGTIIVLFSSFVAGAAIAALPVGITSILIVIGCIAAAGFGIWYASPWFVYHAMLSKLIADWETKNNE